MGNIILCDCKPDEVYSLKMGMEKVSGVEIESKNYVTNLFMGLSAPFA